MHIADVPAESAQDGRLRNDAVACGGGVPVIRRAKHEAEDVFPGALRMHNGRIHTEAGAADAAFHGVAELGKLCRQQLGKGIILIDRRIGAAGKCLGAALGKFQEAAKLHHALRTGAGQVDLIGTNDGIHRHFLTGTGYGDIQSAPAAVLVERAEIHGDLPVLVGAVADGEQDHIPLVTLDIFEVLDEDGLIHFICPRFELRILDEFLCQKVVDQILLHDAEGHDTHGILPQLFIGNAPYQLCHHGLCLGTVLTGLALVVDALHGNAGDLAHLIVRGREGEQLILIETHIAECDQAFVPRAVMPQQMLRRHGEGKAVIENAFQILLVVIFLVGMLRREEGGRRELLGVTDNDHIVTAGNGADGFTGRKLRCLVENDQVKFREGRINVLRHRDRAHEHARADAPQQSRDRIEELADGEHPAAALDGTLENADLRGTAHALRCRRDACRQAGDKLLHGQRGKIIRSLAVLFKRDFKLCPLEMGECGMLCHRTGNGAAGSGAGKGIGKGILIDHAAAICADGTAEMRRFHLYQKGFEDGSFTEQVASGDPSGSGIGSGGEPVRRGKDLVKSGGKCLLQGLYGRFCAVTGSLRGIELAEGIGIAGELLHGANEPRVPGSKLRAHGERCLPHGIEPVEIRLFALPEGTEYPGQGSIGICDGRLQRAVFAELAQMDHIIVRGDGGGILRMKLHLLHQLFPAERFCKEPFLLIALPVEQSGIHIHRIDRLLKDRVNFGLDCLELPARGKELVNLLRPVGQRRCPGEGIGQESAASGCCERVHCRPVAAQIVCARIPEGITKRMIRRLCRRCRQTELLGCLAEGITHLDGVIRAPVGFERGCRKAAKLPSGCTDAGNGVERILIAGAVGDLRIIGIEGDDAVVFAQGFVSGDRLVKRHADRKLLMQRGHYGIEILTACLQVIRSALVGLRRLDMADGKGLFKLIENGTFLRLVGMQLQTERIESDLGKALLYDGERGHLFRDKEHGFALVERIGDHVGDRLGFAGAGRAVQHEGFSLGGRIDGGKLGGIGGDRNSHVGGADLLIKLCRGQVNRKPLFMPVGNAELFPVLCTVFPGIVKEMRLPFQLAADEGCHDLILPQLLTAVADVIPHDELGEGELPEEGKLLNIPAVFGEHGLPDGIEDEPEIHAALILRRRIQAADVDAEILPQQLEQGNIHLDVLTPDPQGIGLVRDLAHQIDRHEDQRGIAGLGAFLRFIPPQEAQGEIQRIGAVFLQGELGGAVELLENAFKLRFIDEGAQAAGLEFRLCDGGDHVLFIFGLIDLAVRKRQMQLGRGGHDLEILPAGDLVLELVEICRHELQICRAGAEIQQGIAQREVKELAFPDLLACQLLLGLGIYAAAGKVDLGGIAGDLRILPGAVIHRREAFLPGNAHRNRPDPAAAAAENIEDKLEIVLERIGGMLPGVVEVHGSACHKIGAFHQADRVDAGGNALGQGSRIIHHAVREGLLLKPAAGKGMPLDEYDQRIEPRCLCAGGIQQGKIQAGTGFLFEHRMRHPDALCRLPVAGRRYGIGNIFGLQCGVDRGKLFLDGIGIAGLVAGEGGIARPFIQENGCLAQDLLDLRVIRGNEGGSHFRHDCGACPLVIGQQVNAAGLAAQHLLTDRRLDRHGSRKLLGQGEQVFRRQCDAHGGNFHLFAGSQGGQCRLKRRGEFRIEPEPDGDMLEQRIGMGADTQRADNGDVILLQGKADLCSGRAFYGELRIHGIPPLRVFFHYNTECGICREGTPQNPKNPPSGTERGKLHQVSGLFSGSSAGIENPRPSSARNRPVVSILVLPTKAEVR